MAREQGYTLGEWGYVEACGPYRDRTKLADRAIMDQAGRQGHKGPS